MLSRQAASDLMQQLVPTAGTGAAERLLSPAWDLMPAEDAAEVAVEIGGPTERVEPLREHDRPRDGEVLIATIDGARLPAFDSSWGAAPMLGSGALLGVYAEVTSSSTEPVGARVVVVQHAPKAAADRGQRPRLPFGPVSANAHPVVTVPEHEVFVQLVDDASEDEWFELRDGLRGPLGGAGAGSRPDWAKLEAELEALPPGPEQNEMMYQHSLLGLHEETDAPRPSAQLLGAPKTVEIDVREFGPLVHPDLDGGDPAAWRSLFFVHNGFGGLDIPLGGGLYVLLPEADVCAGVFAHAVVGFEIS